MKHIKLFEYTSTKIFNKGDLVKFKSQKEYDGIIFFIYSINISNFGNESLLYLYDEYKKYINNEIDDIQGFGWIDNNKIEKISDEESSAIKYNL